MNKQIWIILGIVLIAVVLFATAGCASHHNLNDDGEYARASDIKLEVFGPNGRDR